MTNEYDKQATEFLAKYGLAMRITLSDSKPANWEPAGHHYRVTLSRKGSRLAFDFWGSVNDMQKGEDPSEYDVLACISGEVYTPDTFEEFCLEYGGDEDSIKTRQTFIRANRFAKSLRAFFTEEELSALSEIQ